MAKPAPKRGKNKDNARRAKKRVSILTEEKIDYVDYKDINILRRFVSDRSKIRARRVTGNSTQQQAEVARAIKNAREMALLPYTVRVTTQRGGGRDRGPRADGPPPRPSSPPPGTEEGDATEATDETIDTGTDAPVEAADFDVSEIEGVTVGAADEATTEGEA